MSATVIGPTALPNGALEWIVVEEAGDAVTQEWELPVGRYMTMGHTVLVQSDVIVGSGTVQPILGTLDGLTASTVPGFVLEVDTAASSVRSGDYRNFRPDRGMLYGRSVRSVDTLGTRTRVVVAPGPAA